MNEIPTNIHIPVLSFIVGVIRNIKNKMYKYQYSEVGERKSVLPSPLISLLTELANTVFNSHVAKENTKYGTPKTSAFCLTLLPHKLQLSTHLYFWYKYHEQIKNNGT